VSILSVKIGKTPIDLCTFLTTHQRKSKLLMLLNILRATSNLKNVRDVVMPSYLRLPPNFIAPINVKMLVTLVHIFNVPTALPLMTTRTCLRNRTLAVRFAVKRAGL
jgi:hypothetical protein